MLNEKDAQVAAERIREWQDEAARQRLASACLPTAQRIAVLVWLGGVLVRIGGWLIDASERRRAAA